LAFQLRGPNDTENFDQRLKQLYFDTALYNIESLKLLFRICGRTAACSAPSAPAPARRPIAHRQMVRRREAEYR